MGLRGYTKPYGGWESYIKNLIDNWDDKSFTFQIYEMSNDKQEKDLRISDNVNCVRVYTKKTGNFTMLSYSYKALRRAINDVKKNDIKNPVFLVLGVRIGPIFKFLKRKIERYGIKVIINPDGLEWTRSKWNILVKKYLKYSEKTMIQSSNHIICDSLKIKEYVDGRYKRFGIPSSYIPYGTYEKQFEIMDVMETIQSYGLDYDQYFLYVGRFIPENNIEMIIKGFMNSNTNKKLVLITNITTGKFYTQLLKKTQYKDDKRIIMLGPVYNQIHLSRLRVGAFAYIHGHSAGGTNPSLLESLTHTRINILYNVAFNREVCGEYGFYFSSDNQLTDVIKDVEVISETDKKVLHEKLVEVALTRYSWKLVCDSTRKLFIDVSNEAVV